MKKNKIKCETGRTMLEMLGTLAIIGVLSTIGIMGYRILMRQHTVNEVARAITVAYQGIELGQEPTLLPVPEGVQLDTLYTEEEVPVLMMITTEDEELCKAIKSLFEGRYLIYMNEDCE